MATVQKWAAWVALSLVVLILGSAIVAAWIRSPATSDLLQLTQLILSWPVAAGGLVFGGATAIVSALKAKV
jgi:hypothetical protein